MTVSDTDVELVALATAQHHIVFGRTDAMGNNPCVCDEWWDSDQGPDWDQHMAEVSLRALSAAGRLVAEPPEGERYCFCPDCIRCGCGMWEEHHADASEIVPQSAPWSPVPEEKP